MFVNTQVFKEAAIDFERNKGRYTLAPIGSKEWTEYWQEQEKRCLNGYKVGDRKITGRHYFYLNFCRIQRTVGTGKVQRKIEFFPGFWEIDYDWWWYKEIAWWGCGDKFLTNLGLWRNPTHNPIEYDSLGKPLPKRYGGGKHLSCLKTRRAGFSFKEAADGVYNYNFIPKSKSYFLADKEPFLIVDGILNKVLIDLNWLNSHTDGWWLKNRMKHNTLMHQKASYIDNIDKQEKGFESEIIGVTVGEDPDKARGKDGVKITYEEAGSFTNLKKALDISVPSVKEGDTVTGQISVFGTGGEEGADIEGLDEIFSDPWTYDMLPFINDWEDFEQTECGVYIPCYMANPSHMDSNGNVDRESAIKEDDKEREKASKAKDPKKLDRRKAEFSRTPTEALIRVATNNFPISDAIYQRNRIKASREIQGTIKYGEITNIPSKGLTFIPMVKSEAKPMDFYPHKKDQDLSGCITIVNEPYRDDKGLIPENLYIINVDPYYDEDAEDTTSLGACYVTKRKDTRFKPIFEQDVAWYVGRPKKLEVFYRNLFALAEYYNAKIQSEVGGGGKGILDYARKVKKLHLIEFTPIHINAQEIAKIQQNRTYLMTISTDDKVQGLTYYQESLTEVVGLDEAGNELLRIHFVWDLGLLEEIIKFNPKRNFDRISAQIVKQFMIREKEATAKPKKTRKRLVDNPNLFSSGRRDPSLIILKGDDVYI